MLFRVDVVLGILLSILDVDPVACASDTNPLIAGFELALIEDTWGPFLADITLDHITLFAIPLAMGSVGISCLGVERVLGVEWVGLWVSSFNTALARFWGFILLGDDDRSADGDRGSFSSSAPFGGGMRLPSKGGGRGCDGALSAHDVPRGCN
ncbi:hypothetical protein QBC44DRAFT_317953 [Cladorrhinum sp. PSN332]|nr:hypothetical protein QBC44DRAFT_317953 [Cladorrhinum sp. PSN332]